MRRLVTIFDLDSIVVNLLQPWIDWYNNKWGPLGVPSVTLHDITDYHIEKIVHPDCGMKVFEFFHDLSRYRALQPLEGAVEGLREIHDAGHDIILASAVAGETAAEKFVWCANHLPFIPRKNIFLGARKEILCGDVFVDDAPSNILTYRGRWRDATIMTILYPYNRHLDSVVDLHAIDYTNTKNAWQEIVGAIHELAEPMEVVVTG